MATASGAGTGSHRLPGRQRERLTAKSLQPLMVDRKHCRGYVWSCRGLATAVERVDNVNEANGRSDRGLRLRWRTRVQQVDREGEKRKRGISEDNDKNAKRALFFF